VTPTYAEARPSYIADAFSVQYNLILLGGAVLFSLASASSLPLGAGLVLEAIYLLVAPNLAPFRRYVDARYERSPARGSAAPGAALDPAYAARVTSLRRAVAEIQSGRLAAGPALALALARLDSGLPAFAKGCELDQRIARALALVPVSDPETELARLQAECDAEPDPMQKVSLRLAQNTLKRRVAQQHELAGRQQALQLKLSNVEQSLQHIRARGSAAFSEQELERQLDFVNAELTSLGVEESSKIPGADEAQ
jgi:hypothetical protein